jgi:hypothetical protein
MKSKLTVAFAAVGTAAMLTVVAGCGSSDSTSVPTGADLQGTWSQSGSGYEAGNPVSWENQTIVIDKADGQGFAGYKEYTPAGGQPQKETLNGVIGVDGNILIVDEDGKFEGQLNGNTLQGQYSEVGDDATAMNLEISKQ